MTCSPCSTGRTGTSNEQRRPCTRGAQPSLSVSGHSVSRSGRNQSSLVRLSSMNSRERVILPALPGLTSRWSVESERFSGSGTQCALRRDDLFVGVSPVVARGRFLGLLHALLIAWFWPAHVTAQINVTPDGAALTVVPNQTGLTTTFTVSSNTTNPVTVGLYPSCSGQVTSCTVPQSYITFIFSTNVTMTFSSLSAGSGTLVLLAQGSTSDQGSYTVTVSPYSMAVAPVRDTAPPQAQNTSGFTTQFTVTSTRTSSETLTLTCQTAANVSCTAIAPSTLNLAPSTAATVTVTYSTTAPGWGWVQLTASGGGASASALTGVQVVPYTVAVTPDAKGVGVLASASKTQPFVVQNVTSAAVTYTFAVLCTGTGVSNCSQPASQSISAGSAATVNVSYTSSATLGATGRVRLQASSSPGQDSGWVNVTVGSQMAPDSVDVSTSTPGTRVEPKICVTVAASRGAAYQCGDLRIVHALPTTRTLNRVRTPTLLYSSQHAHPYPLVAANVPLNGAAATPDSVVATLRVNNVVHGRSRWDGADWIPGRASRIVVADTTLARAVPRKDTIYSFTLEVVNYYGVTPTATKTTTGTFAVVDRSASPFGTGWWLAGFEHLDVATKIWTGGDGALRKYDSAGTNVWGASKLDHPDTLKFDGTYYLRLLQHGDTVK